MKESFSSPRGKIPNSPIDQFVKAGEGVYTDELLEEAHKHTSDNHHEVQGSQRSRRMFCGNWYDSSKPSLYESDYAVICNVCSVDAIIGDKSGYPIDDMRFVARFTRYYWNGYSYLEKDTKNKPAPRIIEDD